MNALSLYNTLHKQYVYRVDKNKPYTRHDYIPTHHTTHTLLLSFIHHTHQVVVGENRQARVALEDRMKYSLQLTTLRLNPCRLQGVQALT